MIREFFKTVQNKMHYAVHGNTAAEVIYNRVDSNKDNIGLTNFKGDMPTRAETNIRRRYKKIKIVKKTVANLRQFNIGGNHESIVNTNGI